jgi:hypothetical protein
MNDLRVVTGGQISNIVNFPYTAPTVSTVSPLSIPTEGGIILTLNGNNFGLSGVVTVGSQECVYGAAGYSHTQILCVLPQATAAQLTASVFVNVSGQVSNANLLSYSAPTVTSMLPVAANSEGGSLLTITGSSFFSSGNVTIGGSALCQFGGSFLNTFWSHTQIVCSVPAGEGTNLNVQITTFMGLTNSPRSFSYNAPSILNVLPTSGPTAGAVLLTINGTSFGLTGSVTVGNSPCPISGLGSLWSHSLIKCQLPAGSGLANRILVSAGGQTSNPFDYNYNAPSISTISPVNGPTLGNINITLSGADFGAAGSASITVRIDSIICPVIVQTHSLVICTLPANGIPGSKAVQVTVQGQNSNTASFLYDFPSITALVPPNGPTSGNIPLAIFGTSFPLQSNVTVGGVGCPVITSNTTFVLCTLPAGAGLNQPVAVFASSQAIIVNTFPFNYDRPVISSMNPATASSSGNIPLTLIGANFGTSATISIGGLNCPVIPGTVQHTTAQCTLPEGTGSGLNLPVVITVAQQDSAPSNFSYLPPTVTSISPNTGDTPGAIIVTISGSSFGTSGIVLIGGRSCPIVNFAYSHNEIQCLLPAGEGMDQRVTVVRGTTASTQAVSFSYNPPTLDLITPTSGPTAGGLILTVTGTNLGVNGDIMIGNRVCIRSGLAQSHYRVECKLPEGQGAPQTVFANVSGQVSNQLTFSYDMQAITSLVPATGPTSGGLTLTLAGSNFGVSPVINIGSVASACTILFRNHSFITCTLSAGIGKNLDLVVAAGNRNSAPISFSYQAPAVTAVSGCVDVGVRTSECNNYVNTTITITGTNFGRAIDSPTVTVGPFICHNVVVLVDHTNIRCILPVGVGFDLPVLIHAGNQEGGSPYLSYAGPEILPDTLELLDGSGNVISTGDLSFNSIAGGQTIRFRGSAFGPDGTKVSVTYGAPGQAGIFSCTNLNLAVFNDSTVQCTLSGGIGVLLTLRVTVDLGFASATSRGSDDTISYPLPVIRPVSLRKFLRVNGTSILRGTAPLGEDIVLDVSNIGNDASRLAVFYGSSNQYECQNVQILSPDATILCRTGAQPAEGLGPYRFTVRALNAFSAVSADAYYYPDLPKIYRVSGCVDEGNTTYDCPTDGDPVTAITLHGQSFTQTLMSVKVGLNDCINVTYISDDKATCILPAGVGVLLPVQVITGLLFSAPANLLTYAAPIIDSTLGCDNTNRYTQECPRTGGLTITVRGRHFGSRLGIVFVGGSQCTQVVHDSVTPYRQLKCRLPAGTGADKPVIVIQGGGLMSPTSGSLSYQLCLAGTFAPIGSFACVPCPAGQSVNAPGAIVCKACPVGFYAPNNGSANCTACPAGRYSNIEGAVTCAACAAGTFSSSGQALCQDCEANSIAPHPGSAVCEPCPLFASSAVAPHTRCLCEAGYFMTNAATPSCAACPNGADCSVAGAAFSELRTLPGFWRPTNSSLDFYRCLQRSHCLGGLASGADFSQASGSECSENRGGIMCSTCLPGYRLSSGDVCLPCPSDAAGGGYLFGIIVIIGVIIFLQVLIIIKSDQSDLQKYLENAALRGEVKFNEVEMAELQKDRQRRIIEDKVDKDLANGTSGPTPSAGSNNANDAQHGGDKTAKKDNKESDATIEPINKAKTQFVDKGAETDDEDDGKDHANASPDKTRARLIRKAREQEEAKRKSKDSDDKLRHTWKPAKELTDKEIYDAPNEHVMSIHGPPRPEPNFTYKLKIFVSFFQIATNIGSNLEITWPPSFKSFILYFDVTNFNFILTNIASIDCIAEVSYFRKYLAVVLFPIIIVLIVVMLIFIPMRAKVCCYKSLYTRVRHEMNFWKLFLYFLFVIYPGVSTIVLNHYNCKSIADHGSYILSDLRVPCYEGDWPTFSYLGILFIIIYPVGVPLFFFILLRVNVGSALATKRDAQGKEIAKSSTRIPDKIKQQLSILIGAYRESFWWFEMLDMFHKLFMVCILAFFPRAAQIPVGMCVLILYLIVIYTLNPYLRADDDIIAILSQIELFMLLCAGNVFYYFPDGNYSTADDIVSFPLLPLVLCFSLSLFFLACFFPPFFLSSFLSLLILFSSSFPS